MVAAGKRTAVRAARVRPARRLDALDDAEDFQAGVRPDQGAHRRRRHLPGELHISRRSAVFRERPAALCRPRRLTGRPVFGVHSSGEFAICSASPELFFESGGTAAHDAPDEGNRPARPDARKRIPIRRDRPARIGEGMRRERDDRRHDAQRPRPGGQGRDRPGSRAVHGRAVSDRLADDVAGDSRNRRKPRGDRSPRCIRRRR